MFRMLACLLIMTSQALAQQRIPTTTEMRAAVQACMSQTDFIRQMHIEAEAKAALLTEENAKLKARVQELEAKKNGE